VPEPEEPPVDPPVELGDYVTRAEYDALMLELQAVKAKQAAQDEYLNDLAPAIKQAVIMELVLRLSTPPITNVVQLKEKAS
jgi:hypothetical protein